MLLRGLSAFVLCLALMIAGPSQAQRVYAGEEAAALRCANTLALTAVTLFRSGMMSQADMEAMLGVTVIILDRHVSGTWAQKKAAMLVMRDRRSPSATLDDFRRNATRCLRQFPIN